MIRNGKSKTGVVLGVVGAAGAAYALYKVFTAEPVRKKMAATYNEACTWIDHRYGWSNFPTPVGIALLIGIRNKLRSSNLYDTETTAFEKPVPRPQPNVETFRTADGTYNDLKCPFMGAAGARFGRNFPLEHTCREPEAALMTPNPRVVSNELMTRKEFVPATSLNLLAAAWLQFQIADWFSHGLTLEEDPWVLDLEAEDQWQENHMLIRRTRPDHTRTEADAGRPDTRVNAQTHWWDGAQIYGSNAEAQAKVRTRVDGKIHLENNLFHPEAEALKEMRSASLAGWWVGVELCFTLFALEHNAICDDLKAHYPEWDDEELFQHARLVNAALMAKIHTVEWTPGILGHPALQVGMKANWWGLAGEQVHKLVGRLSKSEVISGIPGSEVHQCGVPYSLTEEFVAVYRMHPLLPDHYTLRSSETGEVLEELNFQKIAGNEVQKIFDRTSTADLLYSFGVMHPGAIQLHNYPTSLQRFTRPDGLVLDVAAHDIFRCREMGVPRYAKFRELLNLKPVRSFEELTDNPVWREEIRRVYNNDINAVDLLVGLFAEPFPKGFGFSDTAFRIFVLMASRRLNADRFFTTDFTEEVYSKAGMDWLQNNTMSTVLLRHYPSLAPALQGVGNAFAPWNRTSSAKTVEPEVGELVTA